LSREIVAVLAEAFTLPDQDQEILSSTLRELGRSGRRFYFGRLKPRERDFKFLLREKYTGLSGEGRQAWLDRTVASMLKNRGEPDLADRLAMDAMGQLNVYGEMRRQAEEQGVVLRAMTSFGGLGMVLYLFLFLALAVILLKYFLR